MYWDIKLRHISEEWIPQPHGCENHKTLNIGASERRRDSREADVLSASADMVCSTEVVDRL